MLLIDSLYINNGGGKVLLDYLVSELEKRNMEVFYLFDSRCSDDYKEIPPERKMYLKAGLLERYRFYKQHSARFTSVFCFGNIPPVIKLKSPVYTYFHNVLRAKPYKHKSKIRRARACLKKRLIKYVSENTSFYIVQTAYVKKTLCEEFGFDEKRCLILPFYREEKPVFAAETASKKDGFVFISNGYPHKNHNNLLKAWEIIARQGMYPELHLTVTSNYPELIDTIRQLKNKGLKIYNHGFINPAQLYRDYKYIIYPSLEESFGLGLIEGAIHGCSILSSDREYVYNAIEPTAVFEPADPQSIADTVVLAIQSKDNRKTALLVTNEIDRLIDLVKNSNERDY